MYNSSRVVSALATACYSLGLNRYTRTSGAILKTVFKNLNAHCVNEQIAIMG